MSDGSAAIRAAGPKVSLLIHNRNRAAILRKCLQSIEAVAYRPMEVLVLDADSTDGSQDVILPAIAALNAKGFEARFVPCKPAGCPASRNLAASEATGELLFFMDNDATIEGPDGVARIVAMFEADPRLAIVSLRILMEDTREIDPFSWVFRRSEPAWSEKSFETFTFAGAGFFARASAYREVQGFWERLIYSREEEEMSYALIAAGWRIAYSPALSVRHYPSGRTKDAVAQRRSIELVNGALVLWRRLPWPIAATLIAGRMGAMLLKALLRDPSSVPVLWKAMGEALRQIGNFGERRRPIGFSDTVKIALLHLTPESPAPPKAALQ